MSKGLVRKLLILLIGVLLVLIGLLFQFRQNNPSSNVQPSSENQDMASVMIASLQQQRRYFQRCWLRSQGVAPQLSPDIPSAELTWQIFLKVEPSGKVKEFALLNKSQFDVETEKCLRDISYRMKFPSFEGEEISITVPIVISTHEEKN